jgi:hypothetical protein
MRESQEHCAEVNIMTQEEDSNGKLHALRSSTNIISDELKDEDSAWANYKYGRKGSCSRELVF